MESRIKEVNQRYQRLKKALERRQADLTVITEDVHKAHNFSAIVRTCDAVGILKVHAVNSNSELPIFNQVARGTEKWVQVERHSDITEIIHRLQKANFKVYAAHLSEKAQDYRHLDYTQPTAILMGSEKVGVSQPAASRVDEHIIIPMMGVVGSLNVSVAAAVILFEAQRQRLNAGLYEKVSLEPHLYHKTLFEWVYPEIAAIYRQKDKPYPNLGDHGEILS